MILDQKDNKNQRSLQLEVSLEAVIQPYHFTDEETDRNLSDLPSHVSR